MKNKKQLAGKILGVSPKKVKFAQDSLEEIKKAITRSDIRGLIAVGKIQKSKSNLHSRAGARKVAAQKKKGRQKGKGSRKGSKHSIVSRKEKWMAKIRTQRQFLVELRDKKLLIPADYRMLRNRSKGGFFRNKRHIKLYLTERNLIKKD
jgi:large subunit ribosomal protein L19e